ncbi:MAG: hypothetical protein JWN37_332 [Candidatus Nomurabacteria bacterium]|nr:hypothetical protein [Candidatus Nomurabacteria bacterium]
MTDSEDEYTVSIRITLPDAVNTILKKEKDRFVVEYGSSYKSEPHITLYLNRYTKEGFPKLIEDLKELSLSPFSFTLLDPIMSPGYRNSYNVDVSNKTALEKIHLAIESVASKYQSKLLRKKDQERLERGISPNSIKWVPHITLGEVIVAAPQPDLNDIKNNIQEIIGQEVLVSDFTVFFYVKKTGAEKAESLAEVTISFII